MNFFAHVIAPVALLVLPLGLTLGPAVTEPCIALLIAWLLADSAARRDWAWLRRPWMLLALTWWGWLVICSLPGIAADGVFPRWTLQAVLAGRFFLCAAAVARLLTARPVLTRWLWAAVVLTALYVVGQLALQFVTGKNLFGHAMRDNGLLTGPFDRPRAGPTLMHLFFPVLLPPVAWLITRGAFGRFMGAMLLAVGFAALLPIGQRMPILLVGFGLGVTVLLLPALRRTAVIAVFVGSIVLAAGAILFPPAQHRLAVHFTAQMADFPNSHYGLIYTRAVAMATQHPWHGRGFAAFRTGCEEARYFVPLLDSQAQDAGGAGICVTHAHNFFLEALTDAGWPGLALFSTFALAVLFTLFPSLRAARSNPPATGPAVGGLPRRYAPRNDGEGREALLTGLFIAALLHLWPMSASNAFTNPFMGAWFALLLGWGLARTASARA